MKRSAAMTVALALLVTTLLMGADSKKDKLDDAKCPVSGKAAKADHAVAYKGAKVYFCCPNCPAAFEKNTAKFSPKANQQLVITGQAEEVKCPLSGRPLNKDTAIEVGGAKVAFCCNNCKAKVQGAKGDEQILLIFSDDAFDKAFKVKKDKK